jgi:tubulin polyglutamylase TTLL6/13
LPKDYDVFWQEKAKDQVYIVKPHANCQGRGIYLTKNPTFSAKEEVVVQEYISNPMLIDGCKFDLRIYALLRSLDPLRIYVYR